LAKVAPLTMRQPNVADVFDHAWAQFTALVEQRGALWGPLPSSSPTDYCLRLSGPPAVAAAVSSQKGQKVGEPDARSVSIAAMIRKQPELRDDVPVVVLLDDATDGCVDLTLCDAFMLREEVEAGERRTRALMYDLFCESFGALASHLDWKYARAHERDVQRKAAASERTTLYERERTQRSALEKDALAKLAEVGAEAVAGHRRLEPAHVALMTRTIEMRRKLREDMERVGDFNAR
jgi:hypothetical protein